MSVKPDALERRRLPRLNLAHEQFRISSNGKIFSVADLSTKGIALRILDGEDLNLFPLGMTISGVLNLKREKHLLQLKVCHLKADRVGCEFVSLSPLVDQAVRNFLDPVALGQGLRPIPSSENGALWYHGASGTDFLLWRGTDGQYSRFALFVLGSYLQWDHDDGVSSGKFTPAHEQNEVRGAIRFETLLLEPDQKPDSGKLSIAKTLILSSNLPQDLKKWCVRQLRF